MLLQPNQNHGAPGRVDRVMSTFAALVSPPGATIARVSRPAARRSVRRAAIKASYEWAPQKTRRVRDTFVSGSAALAVSLAVGIMSIHAPIAHAFVPIRGCGDPGSPYDTGVEVVDRTSSGAGTTGCTKLYQPGRAAEARAVAAAKEAAGTTSGTSESKRDRTGDAPSGR